MYVCISPRPSGDFDPEANQELKKPPDPSEVLVREDMLRRCGPAISSHFQSYLFLASAADHFQYPDTLFWTFYIGNIRENEDFPNNLGIYCHIDQTSPTDFFLLLQ